MSFNFKRQEVGNRTNTATKYKTFKQLKPVNYRNKILLDVENPKRWFVELNLIFINSVFQIVVHNQYRIIFYNFVFVQDVLV